MHTSLGSSGVFWLGEDADLTIINRDFMGYSWLIIYSYIHIYMCVCTHIHINIWEIERLYNQYRSWRKRLIHRLKDAQDQGFIQERLPKCMAFEKLGVGVVLNRVEP